jgi:hypothetical protein
MSDMQRPGRISRDEFQEDGLARVDGPPAKGGWVLEDGLHNGRLGVGAKPDINKAWGCGLGAVNQYGSPGPARELGRKGGGNANGRLAPGPCKAHRKSGGEIAMGRLLCRNEALFDLLPRGKH